MMLSTPGKTSYWQQAYIVRKEHVKRRKISGVSDENRLSGIG